MTSGKKTSKTPDEAFLDAHFDAARRHAAKPDDALLARVAADAADVQASIMQKMERQRPGLSQQGIRSVLSMLGGWPAAASLTSAAAMGLWLGIAPPNALTLMAQDLLIDQGDTDGATSVESGFGLFEEML